MANKNVANELSNNVGQLSQGRSTVTFAQSGKMSGTIGLLGHLMAKQWITQHFVWCFTIIREGNLFCDKDVLY
eukprot:3063523-Ditylum_brightwellii.AAC.1